MSDQETTTATLPDRIRIACAIAHGATEGTTESTGFTITGGFKDLNCKGRGPWWFRMAYRGGAWTYFTDERLPSGTFRAAERRAKVTGDVFPGELVCGHDRGGPVDTMYLVAAEPDDEGKVLLDCTFRKRRDGQFLVSLPDGSEIIVPNPRLK